MASLVALGLVLGLLLFKYFYERARTDHVVTRAGYFWQGGIPYQAKQAADVMRLNKYYVKFFDLDHSALHGAYPVHALSDVNNVPDTMQLVPTVFITNKTLINLKPEEVDSLAGKIVRKLVLQLGGKVQLARKPGCWQCPDSSQKDRRLITASRTQVKLPSLTEEAQEMDSYRWVAPEAKAGTVHEFQFDCDWTATTRDKYFALLTALKKRLAPATISATIRLYQFAHPEKTGVPPVDRGMLMFYNFQSPTSNEAQNSIMDLDVAKDYLRRVNDYALPLDVALPVFRWGLLFRQKKLVGIINSSDLGRVNLEAFFQKQGNEMYESKADTALGTIFLHRGDRLRIEAITPENLHEAARKCDLLIGNDTTTVALFDIQEDVVGRYELKDLEKAYQLFE